MRQSPDFKKAYILANDMLVASRCIKKFPFDAAEFVNEQTDLKFYSFKKAFEKIGLICQDLGSGSAILSKLHGKNVVFYNQDECNMRDSFNRLHETGHFLLEHKTNLTADNPLYGIQEVETNFFTAQMLMPLQVLKEIQRRGYKVDFSFLMRNFGVSCTAAKSRIETLSKRIFLTADEKLFDDIILEKFKAFINKIASEKYENSYYCRDDEMQEERNRWLAEGY